MTYTFEACRLLFEIFVRTAVTKRFSAYTLKGQHSTRNGATDLKKKRGVLKGWLRLFLRHVSWRMKMHLQKCHYLSEFLILREILNFFQKRISRRFIWNRPHWPIGRPNWPNRPFFEWKEFFFSKSMKMTQFRAKLCRPEVADVSNLGRKHIQLVPKLLLHTQNVVISILHLYLWKNMCFISFFSKICSKSDKKFIFFQQL